MEQVPHTLVKVVGLVMYVSLLMFCGWLLMSSGPTTRHSKQPQTPAPEPEPALDADAVLGVLQSVNVMLPVREFESKLRMSHVEGNVWDIEVVGARQQFTVASDGRAVLTPTRLAGPDLHDIQGRTLTFTLDGQVPASIQGWVVMFKITHVSPCGTRGHCELTSMVSPGGKVK